ncbi:MAG: hypothetical protein HY064_06495 [Bacteroidetes bacterium]|nr:hypothetical protein [Bacteroidota bacterium]
MGIQAGAQNKKGQIAGCGNVAFSGVGAAMRFGLKKIPDINGLSTKVGPGVQGTIDYAIIDHLSLGIAYFTQTAKASWTVYTDTIAGYSLSGTFNCSITRNNIGFRTLYHFGHNNYFDPYIGLRIGYSYWGISTNIEHFTQLAKFSHFIDMVWPQGVLGLRCNFAKYFGINIETALGFPYFFTGGINFQFGLFTPKDKQPIIE